MSLTSGRSGHSNALPGHVLTLAASQASHIREVLAEAEAQEEARQTAAVACPVDRRKPLAERHTRARDQEVLRVQRLREEHAQLLAAAWRAADAEPNRRASSGSRAFRREGKGVPGLYADQPVPDKPGTTSQHLGHMKAMYAKLDDAQSHQARAAARANQARAQSQHADRLSGGGASAPSLVDRRDLLAQRDAIVRRLQQLDAFDHGPAASGRSTGRSSGSAAHRSATSGRVPTSARSSLSAASGASFLTDVGALPRYHAAQLPNHVPPIKIRR